MYSALAVALLSSLRCAARKAAQGPGWGSSARLAWWCAHSLLPISAAHSELTGSRCGGRQGSQAGGWELCQVQSCAQVMLRAGHHHGWHWDVRAAWHVPYRLAACAWGPHHICLFGGSAPCTMHACATVQ
jgi:hypothetical protein